MLDEKTLYRIPVLLTDLVVEEDGRAVIISHSTGVCRAVTVNGSGLQVWRLIDGQRALGEIIRMGLEFWPHDRRDEPRVGEDIVAFFDALTKEGCISYAMTDPARKEEILG